ncbi:MAG: hypothetical protein KDE51_21890, partial [Anaerolineales bacterium]|nr:hypothetical protein [Anaerolineales bacterium]
MSKNTKLLFVFTMLAVFFTGSFFVAPYRLWATSSTSVQPHTALAAAVAETAAPCDPTSTRPANTPTRTFIVNTSCDLPDSNLNDNQCLNSAGSCSLRAALEQAAAWSGPNRIEFNI